MKIIETPVKLENGNYLVTIDYGTNSPGHGKDVKQTVLTEEALLNIITSAFETLSNSVPIIKELDPLSVVELSKFCNKF